MGSHDAINHTLAIRSIEIIPAGKAGSFPFAALRVRINLVCVDVLTRHGTKTIIREDNFLCLGNNPTEKDTGILEEGCPAEPVRRLQSGYPPD